QLAVASPWSVQLTIKSKDSNATKCRKGVLGMKPDTNKREFTRVSIRLDVEFTPTQPAAGGVWQVKDVSMNGLYVRCDNPLPIGSDCQMALLLDSNTTPVRIEVGGKVARVGDDGMGLAITEIIGGESFEHLRNLVLYNAPDVDQVEQEFRAHL